MIDNNKIVNALRGVLDPQTGQDIISMKMVEGLKILDNEIHFTLLLKSDDGQIKNSLNFACIEAIQKIYPDAEIHPHLKNDISANVKNQGVLPQVKNIIAVASGKGGVGKSTVSVNLAIALRKSGAKVGLIDADLYGPSVPTMLKLQGQRPEVKMIHGKHKLIPILSAGIHVMSIGFIVEPEQAVVLRGPRLGGIIKQFINDCIWPELDYLIIDLPPGTGDIQLTLVQTVPLTGAIMVTTPQEVSVIDAVKAMNMFMIPNINVPILGVVENMSWFTPEELPDNKYFIFGNGGGESLARSGQTNLLGQIPLIQGVRQGGDEGVPITLQGDNQANQAFASIAEATMKVVQSRNKYKAPTQIVEMKR